MPRRKISDFEDLKHRDSDGDGLSDYDEIFVYHSDPLDVESGHDGFTDYQRAKLNLDSINGVFMKDFFIPNQNNNFKPHILKPKRLFFYSLSAVAIKIFVIAIALVFPATAWLTPDILKAESKEIVSLTNNVRQSLGLEILRENEVLQSAALAKAEDMVVNQYFAHVSPENKGLRYWLSLKGYSYQVAGENLAIGYASPVEVVAAWKLSPTHYSNLVDPDFNEIGVAMISGNYEGFDTKLVAQMFGFQKTTPPSVEPALPVEQNQVAVVNTDEPAVLAEKSINKATPVIVPQSLPQPTILTDINNLLSNQKTIELEISAPEAENIILLVNGQEQKRFAVKENNFKLPVSLFEGQNKISLTAIAGQLKSDSVEYIVHLDTQSPTMDEARSFISAVKPQDDQILIKIEAILSTDTKSVFARYHGFDIPLKQDVANANLWTANRLIENVSNDFFDLVVPATLVASDQAGNMLTQDLAWQKVLLDQPSNVSQYLFIKNTEASNIQPIFDLSTWYYKIMLVVAFLALLLNIFIEIRKQHLQTIASTVGFMALLFLLILF